MNEVLVAMSCPHLHENAAYLELHELELHDDPVYHHSNQNWR